MTLPSRKTRYVALIAGALVGYYGALVIEFGEVWFSADVLMGAVLLNMAVFGAIIAYIMQMLAFVRLRSRAPDIERPYVSPLGNFGATVAAVIVLTILCFLLLNAD